MDFNILYGNLPPHLWETVSDGLNIVRGALDAVGASTRVGTNQLDPKGYNLFVDRFYEDQSLPLVLKSGGVKYGLLCSELVGLDGSWNYGAPGESDPGTYAAFEIAARNAAFIWCYHNYSVAACRKMNPRTAYLPLGFVQSVATLAQTPWARRDLDVLLCGMPSPRRDALMAELSARGVRVGYPGMPVPLMIRDALMERARLNLSVQKTERHDVVSVTRISHSLVNRVPVLLETSDTENPFAKYCLIAEPGKVVETAVRHLRDTDLEAWAQARYDQFRDEMPMTTIMRRVLDETVIS